METLILVLSISPFLQNEKLHKPTLLVENISPHQRTDGGMEEVNQDLTNEQGVLFQCFQF